MTNLLKPSAMFVLKTYDLPLTPGSNATGTLNNTFRSSMTWSNIDLKTIMGTMWEQYDYFTITLVTAIAAPFTVLPTLGIDRSATINLGGLQWVNSSYSIATKANIQFVQMGTVNFATVNTGSLSQNNFMSGVMFVKADRMVNLTITLNRATDGTLLNSTTITTAGDGAGVNPHQTYQFRIDGVDYKQ